jgi:hypothetical protein
MNGKAGNLGGCDKTEQYDADLKAGSSGYEVHRSRASRHVNDGELGPMPQNTASEPPGSRMEGEVRKEVVLVIKITRAV